MEFTCVEEQPCSSAIWEQISPCCPGCWIRHTCTHTPTFVSIPVQMNLKALVFAEGLLFQWSAGWLGGRKLSACPTSNLRRLEADWVKTLCLGSCFVQWFLPSGSRMIQIPILHIKITFNPRFYQPGLAARWTDRLIYLLLIAFSRLQSEAVRHLRILPSHPDPVSTAVSLNYFLQGNSRKSYPY